ncbi:tyrosine-type recombinase/integrase [Luteimonas sp. A478]
MAKVAKELTQKALVAAVRTAIASGVKKMIAVGGVPGLYVQVRPSRQSWLLRYTAGVTEDGKPWRRDLGLGAWPEVGLAEARESAREARRLLRDGIDPIEHRAAQEPRQRPARGFTFDEAAKRLIAAKAPEWKNPKHREQWRNTLQTYASPIIGVMPVDQIEVRHVEAVLSPIWHTKTETASRVRMRMESVLDWATVAGHRTGDNPARWGGNLEHLLASPNKVKRKASQPALLYTEMFRFLQALRQMTGAARALEFLILTATRSGEVRGATWPEIDLAAALWTIPAERMKADREHVVPLPARAVELLEGIPRMAASHLVFPGHGGTELSDSTLAATIRRMHAADVAAGRQGFMDPKQRDGKGRPRVAVPHGFRSTFRDWAAECTNHPRDVAEMALAHTIGDKTEAAYRRGDMLAKRARMMADWAAYIDTPPATGNVTPIRRKAG